MDFQTRLRAFLGQYQTTGWLLVLMGAGLLIQLLVFIGVSAGGNRELYDSILTYLVLPYNIKGLFPAIWTIGTYPFFNLNSDILHILVTGLILWSFGRIHQQLLGEQRTRRLVLIGVPFIGLMTVLLSTVFMFQPATSSLSTLPVQTETKIESTETPDTEEAKEVITLNDSETSETAEEDIKSAKDSGINVAPRYLYTGGLIAIAMMLVISAITLVPDYPIQLFLFGQVKIVWVGLVLFLLELLWAQFFTPQGIALMLGGGLGFLHVYLLKNGTDLTEKIWSFYQADNKQTRMTVKYGGSPRTKESGNTNRPSRAGSKGKIPQEIIDGILDKISDQGYESLSREEKELLFKASTQKEDENSE